MKKIILSIIFFSLVPFTALAISGACSSHGGVNCATQDSATGDAICNDSFVSSTLYSQTDECQRQLVNPYTECSSPTPNGATDMSICNQYQSACDSFYNSEIMSCERSGGNCSNIQPSSCPDADVCKAEVQEYQAGLKTYNDCVQYWLGVNQRTIQEQSIENQIQSNINAYKQTQNSSVNSLVFTDTSLPDATLNQPYSQDIHFNYAGSDTVLIFFSSPSKIILQSISAGHNGSAKLQFTPYEAGQITITAIAKIYSTTEVDVTKTYNLTVDAPVVVTPANPPASTNQDTTPPAVTSASLSTNLSYGLKNNSDVKQLQEFLITKGFLTGNATGNFFALTLKAVKAYQASVGINPTGYVGNLTRTAISKSLVGQ